MTKVTSFLKKVVIAVLFVLIVLSVWFREPWTYLWNWVNNPSIHIADVVSLLLSALIAFLLVILVEWLKGSSIEIYAIDPAFTQADPSLPRRKLLKIGIRAKRNFLNKLLHLYKVLPDNVHAFASLTVFINHAAKSSYRVKWDIAPEPIEYPYTEQSVIALRANYSDDKKVSKKITLEGDLQRKVSGHPRYELVPQALQTENILPDDKSTTSLVVKHQGQDEFWIYDPEYYFFRNENRCSQGIVYLRTVFKSSLGKQEEYFRVINQNSQLEGFIIEKISKRTYEYNL